jgi:hypothetical protein
VVATGEVGVAEATTGEEEATGLTEGEGDPLGDFLEDFLEEEEELLATSRAEMMAYGSAGLGLLSGIRARANGREETG